jgi:drug/metabolite transporter (DMT)-like permease
VSLLLALAAAAAYGAADFLGGLASRKSAIAAVIVASQALALLLAVLGAPLLAGVPDASNLLWGALAGLAYALGIFLLYRGLATGQMSVVAPITGVCAPCLPVLIGLLKGERPGFWALSGVVLAGAAIVLVSWAPDSARPAPELGSLAARAQRQVVFTAIGAGMAFGAFLTLFAQTSADAGLWPLVSGRAVTLLVHLAVALATRQPLRLARASLWTALAGGALDLGANALYLVATRAALISLVGTVTSLYPATTVLLASLVLRERIQARQGLGLMCAALSVLLITRTP